MNADTFHGFPIEAKDFLIGLTDHNDRLWFEAHKSDYENHILTPAKAFVASVGEYLQTISSGIQYDTKTNGSGSIMRIYRDVRFSKDKTPYHDYVRIIFWEGPGKKTDNPGFFLGLDTKGAKILAGQFLFPKQVLANYRKAAADEKRGNELEKTLQSLVQQKYQIIGEQYKRVPKEYDETHAKADLLRFKGLGITTPYVNWNVVSSGKFLDTCLTHYRNMAPLQQWLVQAAQYTES